MSRIYEFEIEQDGIIVACGSGTGRDRMMGEALHYQQQYSQDGLCVMRFGREGALRRVRSHASHLLAWHGYDQELLAQREWKGEA